jgi:hypothetical protein
MKMGLAFWENGCLALKGKTTSITLAIFEKFLVISLFHETMWDMKVHV